MSPFLKALLTLTFPMFFSSCVSSGKYEELENKHKLTQDELAATRSNLIETKYLLAKTANKRRVQFEKAQSLEDELTKFKGREKDYKLRLQIMKEEQVDLKSSLEKARYLTQKAKEVTQQRERILRSYLDRLRTVISTENLDVTIVGGRLLVRLPTDVLFPSGVAKLSKKGAETVKSVASVLAYGLQNQFQIEGHTDTDPIAGGQYKSNWHLGYARAESVLKLFVNEGVAETMISAASFGEHRPRAGNDNPEGKAKNRRIEIVMIPDLSILAEGLNPLEGEANL